MDQYESFEEISRKKIIYFFNPRAKNAGFDLGILASTAPLMVWGGPENQDRYFRPGVTHHGLDFS